MNQAWVLELLGYLASVLVAISLMMSSILRLRIINLAGALCFTVYGLLIHAYPIAAVNFFITIVDLYYLFQMRSTKEYFQIMPVGDHSEYLQYFLTFYASEIQQVMPGFELRPDQQQLAFFVLRNLVPAGLVIAEQQQPDVMELKLDFVIPGYRDFKIATFLFFQQFKQQGIRVIYSSAGSKLHQNYLLRMGFVAEQHQSGSQLYRLNLN